MNEIEFIGALNAYRGQFVITPKNQIRHQKTDQCPIEVIGGAPVGQFEEAACRLGILEDLKRRILMASDFRIYWQYETTVLRRVMLDAVGLEERIE